MGNKSIIKSHSQREIDLIRPLVRKIDVLRPMTAMMSDKDLQNKHLEFKDRLAKGETLDDLLVDAYAVVREATARVRNTPHYPEQIMGGILLHQGRVAQMRTGEGKTQTCLLPAYLNALEGKGVHVITCNDYLSARDAEDMAKVHNFLGLTVGSITQQSTNEERRAAYACDITYVTNSELAFDYLRDNMAIYKEEQVQRGLHYCIIDEVDSVLIDEARMPLRISGQNDKDMSLFVPADIFVKSLERGEMGEELNKLDYIFKIESEETGDFVCDEKDNIINLTAEGIRKAEEFFEVENLADPENLEILHHINLALRANYLLHANDDYMIKDGEIWLIDGYTGRATPGRKFSDGLHQAIEAKEGVKINAGSMTIASVTYQNFFNKYDKKGGMTGTGLSEEREFRDVYYMDVVEVPTHRPVQRIDHPDAVYRSKREKINAIIEEVKIAHAKNQPVLVGTNTVDDSEEISERLKKEGIEHNVLNAKHLAKEAEIVAQSGKAGAVTIATNMAGRGTDVKIDAEARAAGGLKVIGTERYESRRIDDQLRGRSGRQGDVGESQFIVSLEDEILKNFGAQRMIALFNSMGFEEGHKLQHKSLHRTIEAAQHKVEFNYYGTRKSVLEYDKISNEQREIIYEERERILTHDNVHPSICRMIEHIINDSIDMVVRDDMYYKDWDLAELNRLILPIIPIKPITFDRLEGEDKMSLQIQLKLEALNMYEEKIAEFAQAKNIAEIEKVVLLKCIDSKWTRHIEDMDQLKQGIHLEKYSGKDPLTQFKIYAYDMFDEMIRGIREDAIYILYRARFGRDAKREQVARVVQSIGANINIRGEEVSEPIKVDPDEYIIKSEKIKQAHKKAKAKAKASEIDAETEEVHETEVSEKTATTEVDVEEVSSESIDKKAAKKSRKNKKEKKKNSTENITTEDTSESIVQDKTVSEAADTAEDKETDEKTAESSFTGDSAVTARYVKKKGDTGERKSSRAERLAALRKEMEEQEKEAESYTPYVREEVLAQREKSARDLAKDTVRTNIATEKAKEGDPLANLGYDSYMLGGSSGGWKTGRKK